jgi:glucoamylase
VRVRVLAPVVVAVLAAGAVTMSWHRGHRAPVPLHSSTVALDATGRAVPVPPDATAARLLPGSRVLVPADPAQRPAAEDLAAGQRRWLAAGTVPGTGTRYEPMVRDALLDLRALILPGGASLAGPYGGWQYVWPRDASFVAVALARAGHVDDAVDVLLFLQRLQPADGIFEARYRPDGSAVADGRGAQPDGTGWVLWATREVARAAGGPSERRAVVDRLRQLVTRSAQAAARLVDTPSGLPDPAPDYWEVREYSVTLGVAAPLLAGLRSAVDLWADLGEPARADAVRSVADALASAVTDGFAPDYPRHLGRGPADTDAAVAFLLPPFSDAVDPVVERARQAAIPAMRRPAGGVAPGSAWRNDGISWTPETALFALAAASAGNPDEARQWLDFLLAHRTPTGSLPEKVPADGAPAAVAPLTWTGACVVLAVEALQARDGGCPGGPGGPG